MEKIQVYEETPTVATGPFADWKLLSGNGDFRKSTMTWISLILLLILYPGMQVGFAEDPSSLEALMDNFMLMAVLISTIMILWLFYAVIHVSVDRENTGLAGIGFQSWIPRSGSRSATTGLYFAWAIAFLAASNLFLAGLAWFLAQVGLPMPGELSFLIPRDPAGLAVWVVVSFTAGFCEEVLFRGYLMTRLRLLFKTDSWIMPVIVSSMAFGACHAYQGWPGFIVITTYGFLFGLLYVRTGSIWPGIIAHSLQDLSAPFFPQ